MANLLLFIINFTLFVTVENYVYIPETYKPRTPHMDFNDYHGSDLVRYRFIGMTRLFYEEGMQRVKRLNEIRLKYEENPLYEMGYVMGEIIERYRKLVDMAKYLEDYKSEIFIRRLSLVQVMQQTYFEMYHIYNIFHEIPKKYAYTPEFRNISNIFDTTIDALVQTCDEYDQTCRTNTTMTNVWQEINEQREKEFQAQKDFKKKVKTIRGKFFKAFLNGTLEELKKEFAAQNLTMSRIYDLDHKAPGHVPAAPGVQEVYSNPQRGFENLLSWKRPMREKKKRPYPIEYGWSNEDIFFKGWGDEPEENRSYVYSHYIPTTESTPTPKDEDFETTKAKYSKTTKVEDSGQPKRRRGNQRYY